MTMMRWNPIADMEALLRDPFGAQFRRPASGESIAAADFLPPVDIREDDAAYVIEIELAAVDPKAVSIELKDGVLSVRGERARPEFDEGVRRHRSERRFGRFARAFQLPEDADPESIQAESRFGVLTIRVHKRAETQPRSIDIEVH
ncbi:MAG: Hsp20/alpha crystallin family protein [Pseudomonadales bacterium]|jgi:HSP20 family protein|nr:Hsp20/alpha crystallin family protein [Pseudomonadales bacterium]